MAFDAKTVLHGLHLHVVPVLREGIVDAAVVAEFAIEVGEPFPDADGGEVLGLQARDLPLVDGVVGDAAQADLAVRPGLAARPFDAVVEVLGLARRPVAPCKPGERPAPRESTRTHTYPSGTHFSGSQTSQLWYLLVEPAATLGCFEHHPVPGGLVAVLEMQPFAVGSVAEEHRISSLLDRPEDIGAQHQPIIHLDRHVPIDAHAVADFADLAVAHVIFPQLCFMCGPRYVPSPACGGGLGRGHT